LDFDAANVEFARFSNVMPANYSSGGTTVTLHVAFSTAVANTATYSVAWELLGARGQDMDADGFASAQTAGVLAPGTAGVLNTVSITFTDGAQMDSVYAGDGFRLEIFRDAGTASDNAAGDAELRFVYITEGV
jgi:hypothetical protein